MIVRNESVSLQRCIDSVRSQIDELIIVDTGSTDGTMRIAINNKATFASIDFSDFSFV